MPMDGNPSAAPIGERHRPEGGSALRALGLAELVERIAERDDRRALRELHDRRTAFRLQTGAAMLLAEFAEALCTMRWAGRLTGGDQAILDRAYDLTIDKFSHLPSTAATPLPLKSPGPDCRKYFRAFLQRMEHEMADRDDMDPISQEILTAEVLQRIVVRHFRLSCLEARRSRNPARTRYAWHVNGTVLYLWMPASLWGGRRRAWLQQNVGAVDPARPGERFRIQAIVDDRLGTARHVPIGDGRCALLGGRGRLDPPAMLIEEEIAQKGLAETIADEKARHIELQRPAIRALGRAKLKRLILRIFRQIEEDRYQEKALAEAFGLSRPTLSRFAGSRWSVQAASRVPDLWANTAHTLAGHEDFVQTAREARVWPVVEKILAEGTTVQTGGDEHV